MRTIAAASLTAALLLVGCGGDDPSPSTGTTAGGGTSSTIVPTTTAATATTRSAEALEAALLQPADVPGTTGAPAGTGETDLSQCFPGNPIAANPNPSEVDGPALESSQGAMQYSYGSSARVGTPEQATAFVTGFASASGSSCALDAFKVRLGGPPNPVDPSGLTGKPSTVSVGDAGALMTITGNIKAEGQEFPLSVEFYVFHKGGVVVLLSASAINGTLPPGHGLELAQKVAGRLP